MVMIMLIVGGLIGGLLVKLADLLPRFSGYPPTASQWRGVPIGFSMLLGVVWLQFGWTWEMAFFAAASAFFLLIALIDLQHQLVLNILTYPAIAGVLVVQGIIQPEAMPQVLLGGVFAFSIFYLTARLSDLGMGDVKLALLLGVFFGFPNVLYVLLIGGGTGAVAAVILLLQKRGKHYRLPYAPFLCLGAILGLFFV